jgi:tetratricopeptide (TPR) repeat protein
VPTATDLVAAPPNSRDSRDELSEVTRNLEAPDAAVLVEHMLSLVTSEADALLAADDPGGRLADLNVRMAFASWDGLGELSETLRYLELADRHPLAPRLRLSTALREPDALTSVESELGDKPALLVDAAEAWLFRHDRPERAAALCDRLLAHDLEPAWRPHVLDLATLAHAASDQWARVVEIRRGALGDKLAPDEVAATAALLIDRADDPAEALAACWTAIERLDGIDDADTPPVATVTRIGVLRLVDIAIAAAMRTQDTRLIELLERRAALLAMLPSGAVETLATRHQVAAQLTRNGKHAEAMTLWTKIADDPASSHPLAGRRIATLAVALSATAARDQRTALSALRRLAETESIEIAACHTWRALELAAAGAEPSAAAGLARSVADVADSAAAEWWLDLFEVRAPTRVTLARLEARGHLTLRWAAMLAERFGNHALAIQLWQRVADAGIGTELDHLVRLLRGSDEDLLAEVYAEWAKATADPRSAAALWCARGVVDLIRGDFVEGEESLLRAAGLDPKDPFCRAALAAVYRAGKRYDALAQVLAELSTSLTSRESRAAAAREYAELLDEHLGDPAGARVALEQMIADRPYDDDALLLLAKLYDRDQAWGRSIDLRKRAIALATTPDRRAELWLDVAVREERRGDRQAALAALDKAAETGALRTDVLREQARMYRQGGSFDKALALVREELATDPPIGRRMQLQTEQAQLLTAQDREPEAIVAAYLEVLAIEPDQTEALAGIEAPARKLGMWDELARAFRGAPHTANNLEVLAEALAKIAEWAELAEVRRRQLELASSPVEKARRATELARLYEQELGDVDAAIRMLLMAQATHHDDERHKELLRILRGAERWTEMSTVLERELPRAIAVHRQVDILLQLGELRADKLGRRADAVTSYEAALARDPNNPIALARLEKLYEALGHDRELALLLEARADSIDDLVERAKLFGRVGQLRSNRGEVDGSIAAYLAAIRADPTNRDVFTAMERVCYKAERWAAAMQLYDVAIAHVEGGASRAYRLGDLYARRANVQLSFLGQVDAAIASYQKVIEVDSQPQAAVTALEDLCRTRNDFAPLVDAFERRAEVQKDSQRKADALRSAARLAVDQLHDQRASVRLNRKLLAIDPNDPNAQSVLEAHYEDTQDRSGLVDVLKLKLQHASAAESLEILKRIARVSEEGARDVETATEHYQKVLQLQPENREALDALGRIYESTEQWAELVDVTRRLIKLTSDRNHKALLYFKCGSVMEAKFGREQDAIRYYDAAIKTTPNCLPAVHGLRDLYRRREEWPRVIETLELEVKLWAEDNERAGVFAQIGRIYEKQLGDAERAMEYYDSALAVDPDCLPANQALFEYHFDRGEWDRAQPIGTALAEKAIRDGDPTTRSEFYRKRGVVARNIGDPRAAADALITALEIRPVNNLALDDLNALARVQPDVWDFDTTYKELEKVYKKRDDASALMARVHVGRAALVEREGDLDTAATHYQQALELAPTELTVLSALVEFHASTRHWKASIDAIQKFVDGDPTPENRLAVLMRQAAIHADGEMDALRAIAVLDHVIQIEPGHQDAYYLLAQQYFLVGRYADARGAIDRVIELATSSGQPLIPQALARYYYYKGRIVDAAGDGRAAAPHYRRAIEYDPGYAPPALVLARRAAETGDERQAEALLIEAAHAAMAQGGPRAAVPLQRGIARILLGSQDRPGAIEAYRGILNVEPDGASDRVALAEIYAVDDPARAISELRKVLDRDIYHAPAYRLLASFYTRTGDAERAHRVLTALDLLGFSEQTDRVALQQLRATRRSLPLHRGLDEASREGLLATSATREPLGDVWSVLAEQLTAMVAKPSLGDNLVPAASHGDTRLFHIASEIGALFQVEVAVFVGDKVPGLFAATAFPSRLFVIDRSLVTEGEQPLRFLFGYAYEAIRGGYAALLQMGARQRRELGRVLRELLSGSEPQGPAAELFHNAGSRAAKVLERHAGARDLDPGAWMDSMLAGAKRAGLVACDDFAAAIWMVARLSGQILASHDDTVALGAVLGGPDLVRFYLSDNYQLIRDLLAAAM